MSMNTPTASAEALAEYLGRGGQPVPQPAAIGLNPGEVQYHMSPFTGYTYEGRDVSYRQISPLFISLRGCMMSILLLPLNLTLRGIASLRGAQRWRKTFGGTLYVTNQRLIANTGSGILNFAYYDIAQFHLEGRGIYLALHNNPAVFIDVGRTNPWLYVLLSHLVANVRQ